MSVAIELKNITKVYSSHNVLDQLNMVVNQGDIYGLMGDTGAGKTTALKTILGLLSYETGERYVYDEKISSGKIAHTSIGAVLDSPSFYTYLSGENNLKMYANLTNIPYKKVQEVLEIVGIDKYKRKKVSSYNAEMVQCLAIARAFLTNPDIIIFDEPTKNLSIETTERVHSIIKDYAKKYVTTFIYCSQHNQTIYSLCNRAGLIENGQMKKEGKIKEFMPKFTETYEIVSWDIQKLIYILNGYVKLSQISDNSIIIEIEKDKREEMNEFLTLHNIDIVSLSKRDIVLN